MQTHNHLHNLLYQHAGETVGLLHRETPDFILLDLWRTISLYLNQIDYLTQADYTEKCLPTDTDEMNHHHDSEDCSALCPMKTNQPTNAFRISSLLISSRHPSILSQVVSSTCSPHLSVFPHISAIPPLPGHFLSQVFCLHHYIMPSICFATLQVLFFPSAFSNLLRSSFCVISCAIAMLFLAFHPASFSVKTTDKSWTEVVTVCMYMWISGLKINSKRVQINIPYMWISWLKINSKCVQINTPSSPSREPSATCLQVSYSALQNL